MKWQGGRKGGTIEDRRGMSGGRKLALGGVGGVIVLLISLFLGGDPGQLLQQIQGEGGYTTQQGEYQSTPEEDRLMEFSEIVLTSTDEVWSHIFEKAGQRYPTPTLLVWAARNTKRPIRPNPLIPTLIILFKLLRVL